MPSAISEIGRGTRGIRQRARHAELRYSAPARRRFYGGLPQSSQLPRDAGCHPLFPRSDAAPEVFDSALGTPSFGIRRRLDGGFTVGYRNQVSFHVTPDAIRYFRDRTRPPRYSTARSARRASVFGAGSTAVLRWATAIKSAST